MCRIEKIINSFYKKYSECKDCNRAGGLERYTENKVKISKQQKKFFEKNTDKLLQKQNNRYLNFKEIRRSYVELQNRLKALEDNF